MGLDDFYSFQVYRPSLCSETRPAKSVSLLFSHEMVTSSYLFKRLVSVEWPIAGKRN